MLMDMLLKLAGKPTDESLLEAANEALKGKPIQAVYRAFSSVLILWQLCNGYIEKPHESDALIRLLCALCGECEHGKDQKTL